MEVLTPTDLKDTYRNLNQNGHNRVVFSFEENQGWEIPLSSKTLEDGYFLKDNDAWNSPRGSVTRLFGMVSNHLNISELLRHRTEYEAPSLIICIHCDPPSPVLTDIKVFLMFVNVKSFVYCETGVLFRETGMLAVLFAPYDLITWVVLLFSLIALRFVPNLNFWKIADLVWIMLGQPPQRKRHGLLIILISTLLIVIQTMYVSYFTSNVVKPFEKLYIDSNQELLDSDYKIVVDNGMSLAEFTEKYTASRNDTFRKLKLDFDNMEQYFLYSEEIREATEDISKLVVALDEGAMAFYRKFEKQYLKGAESKASAKVDCHMLKEPWEVQRITVYFKGHLTEPLYQYLGNLISSGFFQFWEMSYFDTVNRRTRKSMENDLMQGERGVESASMKTSLKSFFKLCTILFAFDILCFVIELLIARLGIMSINIFTKFKLLSWYWKNHLLKRFN